MAPKSKPTISVIERRLQGPSALTVSTPEIAFKDPIWQGYWCNTEVNPHQLQTFLKHLGWIYVEPTDLDSAVEELGATVSPEGRIVRGPRGQEVLLKMPKADYARIQKMKADENIKNTFGQKQIKDAIVAGVGGAHGEEAADFVSRRVNTISVRDERAPEDSVA